MRGWTPFVLRTFPRHSGESRNPEGWCRVYDPPASRYARRVPLLLRKKGREQINRGMTRNGST